MGNNTPGLPRLLGDSNRLRVTGVNALGPLERQLMDYIWTHGNSTVGDVHKAFRHQGHDMAYTTVMTTMARLASKGLLNVDKSHVTYVYAPAMSREEYTDTMVARVLDVLVDTDAEAVFAHLARRLGRATNAQNPSPSPTLGTLDSSTAGNTASPNV